MPAFPNTGLSPRDVAWILFRHWRKIALVFCGVILLGLLAIVVYPRSYASEAKLMIRIGRESVGLDPTATTGDVIMLQKTQDDEVNSALGILTSRKVLERVVDQVGADRILGDLPVDQATGARTHANTWNPFSWVSEALVALRLSDPGTKTDQAVRCLEKRCEATAPKQSAVISVRYSAPTPQLAHDVVEAMTTVFLEEHSRLNQTEGSLEFFAEQSQKLFDDLTAAQQKLRDRKNAYELTTAQGPRSMLEQAKDAMRHKVYDLELQENDLASRYTDDYPPLKELRRQRDLAEKMLLGIPTASEAVFTDAASSEPQRTKASPASLQVAKPNANMQGKMSNELQTLNDQEFELAQLEREVKLLEGKYAMHVQKLEQARINDALGREKITNVKVAQPATLVYKPVSPKKMLLMLGALVLAVAGSLGFAVSAERLDPTLRSTDQVERELGLPVLVSLPYRKRNHKQQVHSSAGAGTAAVTNVASRSAHGERHANYRRLVAALRSTGSNGSGPAKTIGVVGCESSKKLRSRIAAEMAEEAASAGTGSVLLIDGDVDGRRVSKRFNLNGSPGWCDVLAGSVAAKGCIQPSNFSNLAVMGPGRSNGEAPAKGSPTSSAAQLDGIKSEYRLVLVDLPPGGEVDAAKWIDEAVLVVDAERTRIQSAQRAKEMLHRAGVPVTGVVLANRREYIPRWLYKRL